MAYINELDKIRLTVKVVYQNKTRSHLLCSRIYKPTAEVQNWCDDCVLLEEKNLSFVIQELSLKQAGSVADFSKVSGQHRLFLLSPLLQRLTKRLDDKRSQHHMMPEG